MNNFPLYLSGVSIIGILFSLWAWLKIKKSTSGDQKMEEISRAIEEGSRAFIKRQYKVVALVAIIIAALLYFFIDFVSAVGFLVGGAASALAGYLGMMTAVKSNVKVAEAAKKHLRTYATLKAFGHATEDAREHTIIGMKAEGFDVTKIEKAWKKSLVEA